MFCEHLAGFAVFGAIDPIAYGWLDEFLTKAAHRERMHWIRSVTRVLREANDQAKESAWDRWINQYLQRRVEANPIPLDAEESGAMCEWALILRSHYAKIVELLLRGPAPAARRQMFYSRLKEAELLDRAPVLTAQLLIALLSQEDSNNVWDLGAVHDMVSQLIELEPAEPILRALCEQLGRLNSPRALDLQNRLR
jgi:hypothetical protein